jgi:type III secretion protein W
MAEPTISHLIQSNAAAISALQAKSTAMQVESADNITQYFELAAFNPMQRSRNFKNLDELKSYLQSNEGKEEEDVEKPKVEAAAKVDDAASRFQKENFEMNAKTLLILKGRISADDTPEEALGKVLSVYPDPSLADQALDFLIETADPQTITILKVAKENLNKTFERQVKAGRNIGAQARAFSEAGLGAPTTLRDLYREITGSPREPLVLFNQLTEKFRYDKLRAVIHFLLHSLGSDLKSKGPSMPRIELKRLIDETRSLQGILGVFRFFLSRMALMHKLFSSFDLAFPGRLDFEVLSKVFIKLLAERYVNPEKILQTAKFLGIEEEVAAQIIVYTQMKDAIRQVAPKYFRDPRHREELIKSYIDTLETLEDKMEEEGEEEKKKREKKKKK